MKLSTEQLARLSHLLDEVQRVKSEGDYRAAVVKQTRNKQTMAVVGVVEVYEFDLGNPGSTVTSGTGKEKAPWTIDSNTGAGRSDPIHSERTANASS